MTAPSLLDERVEVLPLVIADLESRIAGGAKQYGEPLTTHNGRDTLWDAYEEALDLCLYLRQTIEERRSHHAEIADMAKRLEVAERKVSRLTAMRNEWERDAREHLMTFGQHLPASVECLVERFDAAIAAAQEGEG